MNIIKYIENLLEKENTVKNVGNFTPYGTDPKKDKMVKSNYWRNRLKIAYRGYGLDVLINDEDWEVRKVVGEQGYGLGILVNDENWRVREAVLHYLKENNLTLAEWCNQNNKEIDLRKLAFSPYPEVRIVAIESGYVYKESEMYIASDCKFISYGTDSEKDKMVKSDDLWDHLKMAEEGYGLDVLINDEDWEVRTIVAKQGYGLDILVNDESWIVRRAVARQGYGLDILVNDEDWGVRRIVADQGYGLDVLINDKHWIVREAVAKQGYGLNVLINDEYWVVRRAVAKQGYGLNILINYKHEGVRKAALDYLKEKNLTISEWCNQNNTAIDLRKLAFSPYPEVRAEAVRSGYIYKKDEIYIDSNCKFIPYGTNPEKDKMVNSDDWRDRLEMAEEGYGLDILINDENWRVRRTVAEQGYGLNVLINDEDYDVRVAVAEQGYGLNILINDEDWEVQEAVKNYLTFHNLTLEQWKSNQEHSKTNIINTKNFIPYGTDSEKDKMVKSDNWRDRLEMAKQGYGLEVLINDEDWSVRTTVARQGYGLDVLVYDEYFMVRQAVAKQGYGLNILINDENCDVRTAALDYLKENNLSLPEWSKQNPQKTDSLDTSEIIKKANNSIRELENMISQIQVDLAKTKKSLEKMQDFSNIEKEK